MSNPHTDELLAVLSAASKYLGKRGAEKNDDEAWALFTQCIAAISNFQTAARPAADGGRFDCTGEGKS
jgi:hypothetical protein